eukprot:Tbor_TRINITY_DN3766_c0_g1::TRINITY_DN3766_c0_g1_i1::g.2405::m.2405
MNMNHPSIYFGCYDDDDSSRIPPSGTLYSITDSGLEDNSSSISNLRLPDSIRPPAHHLSLLPICGSNGNSVPALPTDISSSIKTQTTSILNGDHSPVMINGIPTGTNPSLQHDGDMRNSYKHRLRSSATESGNLYISKPYNRSSPDMTAVAEGNENSELSNKSQGTNRRLYNSNVVSGSRIPSSEVIVKECNLITSFYTNNVSSETIKDSTTETKSAEGEGFSNPTSLTPLLNSTNLYQQAHQQSMQLLSAIGESKGLRLEMSERAGNYLRQLSRAEQIRQRFRVISESDRLAASPPFN